MIKQPTYYTLYTLLSRTYKVGRGHATHVYYNVNSKIQTLKQDIINIAVHITS